MGNLFKEYRENESVCPLCGAGLITKGDSADVGVMFFEQECCVCKAKVVGVHTLTSVEITKVDEEEPTIYRE